MKAEGAFVLFLVLACLATSMLTNAQDVPARIEGNELTISFNLTGVESIDEQMDIPKDDGSIRHVLKFRTVNGLKENVEIEHNESKKGLNLSKDCYQSLKGMGVDAFRYYAYKGEPVLAGEALRGGQLLLAMQFRPRADDENNIISITAEPEIALQVLKDLENGGVIYTSEEGIMSSS